MNALYKVHNKLKKEAYSRVLNEQVQLSERLEGLSLFLNNKENHHLVNSEEFMLMCTQQDIMREYLEVLHQRAKLMKNEIKED
jgi:hypothetical protein